MEGKNLMNATISIIDQPRVAMKAFKRDKKLIKILGMTVIFILTSCSALPYLADDVEKIADDNAVTVKVNKEAMQKDTDVKISIDVLNKVPS